MATEPVTPQEQTENARQRSTIEFPYLGLDDSLEIAKTIHTAFGTSCQREQLAAQLQQSGTGGGFNLRLTTAKMFGLITYERGSITLGELGMRAADSQQEKAARAEAFLNIPLYKVIYETYRGKALPPTNAGLEAEMVRLGVAPKQKDRARQVFQRSAKEAGFFWSGSDRLVMPSTGKAPLDRVEEKPPNGGRAEQPPPPPAYPHFIQGLLNSLPKQGEEWSKEDRAKWLQLAALAFDMMYVDKATGGVVVVEFKKGGNT